MNFLERTEYVALRLIRRFLISERTANRLSGWLPYYRSSVNETAPREIVDAYVEALVLADCGLVHRRVAEIGAGRTNLVAYGLAQTGASSVVALEPFVSFDRTLDRTLLRRFDIDESVATSVRRESSFDAIGDGAVDLILSNSVLEHVADLATFFRDCRRTLAPAGAMLHLVDYRDHFFKYPYAFLTFDDVTWRRWLDPGDLPRWRLGDHVAAMERAGFEVRVLRQESLAPEFARVRPRLAPRFAAMGDGAAVTSAALFARRH